MNWSRQIRTLPDVIGWDLCSGCGACCYACPTGVVSLVNIASAGIRPSFSPEGCGSCVECLPICPGFRVEGNLLADASSKAQDRADELGPYLEIWEGFATDKEIRFKGSSGGVLSAISLYCLEREDMEFVLHAGMDESKPWTNKTVQSRNRSDILKQTGSRYAPASPCDGLKAIEESSRPCVFIGKPCDTEAVAMLRRERPKLSQNLGLVLTFFCAGVPNSKGTLDLLKSLDVAPETISSVRYRGEGWPGGFKVRLKIGPPKSSLPTKHPGVSLRPIETYGATYVRTGLGKSLIYPAGTLGISSMEIRTRDAQLSLSNSTWSRHITTSAV